MTKRGWFWATWLTFLAGGVASIWSRDLMQFLFWVALGICLLRIVRLTNDD